MHKVKFFCQLLNGSMNKYEIETIHIPLIGSKLIFNGYYYDEPIQKSEQSHKVYKVTNVIYWLSERVKDGKTTITYEPLVYLDEQVVPVEYLII